MKCSIQFWRKTQFSERHETSISVLCAHYLDVLLISHMKNTIKPSTLLCLASLFAVISHSSANQRNAPEKRWQSKSLLKHDTYANFVVFLTSYKHKCRKKPSSSPIIQGAIIINAAKTYAQKRTHIYTNTHAIIKAAK